MSNLRIHHYNTSHANKTLKWAHSDSSINYKKNMNTETSRKKLEELGWIDYDFDYRYNSHGFRCPEFEKNCDILAFGCSFTEGIGLPVEFTWPYILSKKLGSQVWNLGVGGSSTSTVYRLVSYYIELLSPKIIFINYPSANRFEIFNSITEGGTTYFPEHTTVISSQLDNDLRGFGKHWYYNSINSELLAEKNMYAIKYLCHVHNTQVYFIDSLGPKLVRYILSNFARDLQHPGIDYQTAVADYFYSTINAD